MRSVKHGRKKGHRYRYNSSAVKRQNKREKKKLRKIVGCPIMDKAWNANKTTRQNLSAMGLAYDSNEVVGEKLDSLMEVEVMDLDEAKTLSGVGKQKTGGKLANRKASKKGTNVTGVLTELEEISLAEAKEVAERGQRKRAKAKLAKSDLDFCEKLIAKHGEDFEAMSRDPLNLWQNTPKQIERKLAVYKKVVINRTN